jgi:hypothetical protein
LDRSLAAAAGWIRQILSTEQKKTDFNPQVAEVTLKELSSEN